MDVVSCIKLPKINVCHLLVISVYKPINGSSTGKEDIYIGINEFAVCFPTSRCR